MLVFEYNEQSYYCSRQRLQHALCWIKYVISDDTYVSQLIGGLLSGSQICGAGWRINIYQYQAGSTTATTTSSTTITSSTSSTSTTTSSSATASPTWYNYGCVAEGTTGSRRSLTSASFSQSNMTPQLCQNLCSGYQYAGVEYG